CTLPIKSKSNIFYRFNFIKAIRQAEQQKHSDTYGNDVVSKMTWRRWVSPSHFKKDDFSLKGESRAGCSKSAQF
ncbi:unnamed protein product, partial [Hymenolepis diminuta]